VGRFDFDDQVAEVFPDMIARSVPGYASILSMIEQLAQRFSQPSSNVYDLGCSLGAATEIMRPHLPPSATLHAVDSSPAMVMRLRQRLATSGVVNASPVVIHEADIQGFAIDQASFVVLNFTLQFVPAANRQSLLQDIFDGMLPGGALLLSEKICFDDGGQQSLLTELHHDFKRANGYSDLEIAQKRTAIENRLIPETLTAHCERLHRVGFEMVAPWFQCFNFVSLLAVKADMNHE
jgi:tRNA (cmo5U34)-methyltransferase